MLLEIIIGLHLPITPPPPPPTPSPTPTPTPTLKGQGIFLDFGLHWTSCLWITLKLILISVDDVAGVVNGVDQARRGPSGEKIWSAWSSTGGESDLI